MLFIRRGVGIAKKWRLTPAVSIYIVLTGFPFKVSIVID